MEALPSTVPREIGLGRPRGLAWLSRGQSDQRLVHPDRLAAV